MMFSMLYQKCLVMRPLEWSEPHLPQAMKMFLYPWVPSWITIRQVDLLMVIHLLPLPAAVQNAATLDRLCVCCRAVCFTHGRLLKTAKLFVFKRATLIRTAAVSLTVRSFFHERMFGHDRNPPADIQAHSVRGLSSSTALLRDMSLEDVSMASLCPSIRFYQRDKFQFWVIHCWMCLVMFDVIFYCLGWQLQPLVSHTLRLEAVMHYEYCAHALS